MDSKQANLSSVFMSETNLSLDNQYYVCLHVDFKLNILFIPASNLKIYHFEQIRDIL